MLLLSDPADGGEPLWHIGTVFMEHGEAWVLHNSHSLGSAALHRLEGLRHYGLRVEGFYEWAEAAGEPSAASGAPLEPSPPLHLAQVTARAPGPATAAPDTTLVVTPHPVLLDGQRTAQAALVPGESLASFLARQGVLPGEQWRVTIAGAQVPEAMWRHIRPKAGQVIEALRVPEKEAFRLLATIAIIYLSVQFGPQVGGAFGLTGQAASIAGSVIINTVGNLVLNKLLPPSVAKQSTQKAAETTYSLSGGRNRARPFEPMALVLGEPYCVPDLAAQPYTYFAGGELFLWQLFHAGINCGAVHTLRIGQTAVGNYQDVTLSRAGFMADNTGLPALAASVDTVAGGLLDAPTEDGPPVVRTSSAGTIALAVDIEASLFVVNRDGNYASLGLRFGLEYRLLGSSTWLPFDESVPANGSQIIIYNASTKPVRLTYMRQVPAGQYEVRAWKGTVNASTTDRQNTLQWSTLKSYQQDTADYAGQARVGVQIRASGQLNGAIDELNWQAVAQPMPYWNGAAWVTATSRATGLCNPGAQFLALARGLYDVNGRLLAGLGLPDEEIEIEQLKLFMLRCAAKGFEFDLFLQDNISIDELLDNICAAGMGAKSWHTGKLGVIWYAEDQVVEHVQNMGSMKLKSFSVDYDTLDTADEIEFQYFDRERDNTWQSIRVLAPGVTAPTSTARQQLRGVSTEAHAAVLARFSMAQNVYQRKTVSFATDLEHLVFRRGTLMAISHDLTQWGYGGRLRAASRGAGDIVTLTLDELVPSIVPAAGTGRHIALRLPGESSYRLFGVAAFTGPSRTLTLTTAWPAGVPLPGEAADNPAMDTLWIYDFKAAPGQRLRVAEVAPEGNLAGARAALVPEGPEFWNYVWTGDYTPPPNNSLLVQDLPVVSALQVTVQRLRQGDTWVIELTVTFDVSGNLGSVQLWAAPVGNALERIGGDIRGTRASLVVQPGQAYAIEVRPFDTLGRAGTKGSTTYTVAGGAPTTVQGLTLAVMPRGVVANWGVPEDLAGVDWAATVLRTGASWAAGAPVFDGKANSHNLGWLATGTTTLWAVNRNTAGEESAPVSATITVLAPGQPIVQGGVQGSQVVLAWQDCTTTQPLQHYLVRVGATWETAVGAGSVSATSFARAEPEAGTRLYWVAAVDLAGNIGAPGYVSVATLPSIDLAIAALEAGLDDTTGLLLDPATGLAATRLLADAAAQDVAILEFRRATETEALAQTTLRAILTEDGNTRAEAAARQTLDARVDEIDGLVTAQATALTEVAAEVDDVQAYVSTELGVTVDGFGNATARYKLVTSAAGRLAGIVINNETGTPSTIVMLSEKFAIALQSVGGDVIYPFIAGLVDGIATVGINGLLVVDGTIKARHIDTVSLSALSANLGEVTAGVLRNVDNTVFFNLNATGTTLAIQIADAFSVTANGNLQLKGDITASRISVGTGTDATRFFDPAHPTISIQSSAAGVMAYSGNPGATVVTSDDLLFKNNDATWPITRRIRTGVVFFSIVATTVVDDQFSLWWRRNGGIWTHLRKVTEPQSGYGGSALGYGLEITVAAGDTVQFGVSPTDESYLAFDMGKLELRDCTVTVQGRNF